MNGTKTESSPQSGRLSKAVSFGGAVTALGAAALVARVACPGGCSTCVSCVGTLVPAASSAIAVGAALSGSYAIKRARRRR